MEGFKTVVLNAFTGVYISKTDPDPLKFFDRETVKYYVNCWRDKLKGALVLDYGCGKFAKLEDLRYRALVEEAGGTHVPWDPFNAHRWCSENTLQTSEGLFSIAEVVATEANVFDVVLSIQMLAEPESPAQALLEMYRLLKPGGVVILTYTTCWREADDNDKWRYTRSGFEHLVRRNTSFQILDHVCRARVRINDYFNFSLGGGALLQKP